MIYNYFFLLLYHDVDEFDYDYDDYDSFHDYHAYHYHDDFDDYPHD